MLIGRSSLVQSNVLQWSPTKLTVDLQEARRQHRSRNRSTEYLRFQRFKKEQISRDIRQLESSWSQFQYQRKKDILVESERSLSRSLKKQWRTSGIEEPSPEKTKGIQLVSKMQIDCTMTPQKVPHRTQIFLPPNKTNKVNNAESALQQSRETSTKPEKCVRKSRTNTPTQINEKPFQYFNKIFTTQIKKALNSASEKRQTTLHTAIFPTNKKHKTSCEQFINSHNNSRIQNKCQQKIKEIVARTLKKVKIKKTRSSKQQTSDSLFGMASSKALDCTKMEIQSILFQKNVSRLH